MYTQYGHIFISDESYRSIERRKLEGWQFPVEQKADEALPTLHTLLCVSSNQVQNVPLASTDLNSITKRVISKCLIPQKNIDSKILDISEYEAKKIENIVKFWSSQKCDLNHSKIFFGF